MKLMFTNRLLLPPFLSLLLLGGCQNFSDSGSFKLSNFLQKQDENNVETLETLPFKFDKLLSYFEMPKLVGSPSESLHEIDELDVLVAEEVPDFGEFSSQTREEVLIVAINSHPKVRSAISDYREKKEIVGVVEAGKKFTSGATANVGLLYEDEETDPGGSIGLNAAKLMYDSGMVDFKIESANKAAEAAKIKVFATSNEIALNALNSWVDIGKHRETVAIYEDGLSFAEPLLSQIKDISVSGLTDKKSLLRAQKDYANLELTLEKAKIALEISEKTFHEFFPKVDIMQVGKLLPQSPPTLQQDIESVADSSEFIKIQKVVIEGLMSQLKSLEASKRPRVSFRAGATIPAENVREDGTGTVGVVIDYVFNDGGKIDAEVKSVKEMIASSKAKIHKAKRELIRDYKSAEKTYQLEVEKIAVYKELILLTEDVRDTAKAQLVSGRSKIEDVLESEVELARLKIEAIDSEASLNKSAFSMNSIAIGLHNIIGWSFQ